ncbi:MAG: T9SS type A sorting domain-containing protein, partial [Bacteroidia bacterium]|nr:T9SS type A sorting domain-containing protein [Bacteroidia bacterium]
GEWWIKFEVVGGNSPWLAQKIIVNDFPDPELTGPADQIIDIEANGCDGEYIVDLDLSYICINKPKYIVYPRGLDYAVFDTVTLFSVSTDPNSTWFYKSDDFSYHAPIYLTPGTVFNLNYQILDHNYTLIDDHIVNVYGELITLPNGIVDCLAADSYTVSEDSILNVGTDQFGGCAIGFTQGVSQIQAFNPGVNVDLTTIEVDVVRFTAGDPITYTLYDGPTNGFTPIVSGSSTTNTIDFTSNNITLDGSIDYSLELFSPALESFGWYTRSQTTGDLPGSSSNKTFLFKVFGESTCFVKLDPPKPSITGYGPEGNAMILDGVDDYFRHNSFSHDNRIPATGDYTVMLWAKQLSDQNLDGAMVSGGAKFYLGVNDDIPPKITAGEDWPDTGVDHPRDNNWHHYALVRTGSDTYLYLDGQLVATKGSSIANPQPGAQFRLGTNWDLSGFFHGMLDEVRIYNEALSPGAITCLMYSIPAGSENNLLAWYDMENTCENIEVDFRPLSGNISENTLYLNSGTDTDQNNIWVDAIETTGTWTYDSTPQTFDPQSFYFRDYIPGSIVWTFNDFGITESCTTVLTNSVPTGCTTAKPTSDVEIKADFIDYTPLEQDIENETEISKPVLKFYPNPVRNRLTVESSGIEQDIKLELLDISGRLVDKFEIEKGKSLEYLDLSKNLDGLYLMKTRIGDKLIIQRLVIQR